VIEHNGTEVPPRHSFRLGDLRPWHVVTAWCVGCDRKVVLSHQILWRGRSRQTRLFDLEVRLRCTRCGARNGHRVDIAMAPRNT
jgi:hypothetical protein